MRGPLPSWARQDELPAPRDAALRIDDGFPELGDEVEGLEVVPNDCPEIQDRPEDDLGPFRKAFEEK